MSSFGDRLKEERYRTGYTQVTFASLLGVTRSTYNRYENNMGSPDPEFMRNLDEKGCDVYYILTGKRMNPANQIKLYEDPADALEQVADVQAELNVVFSGKQIKALIKYAYLWQASKEQIIDFIRAAYILTGREDELPQPKSTS